MQKDMMGNPIEPGDKILRSKNSWLQVRTVVRCTQTKILVLRDHRHDPRYGKFANKPLAINGRYNSNHPSIINLTKLNIEHVFDDNQ